VASHWLFYVAKAVLPSIVVQPIGYEDAKEILLRMGGVEAPADWQARGGSLYQTKPNSCEQILSQIFAKNFHYLR
jgi:hypothetical protein